MFDIYLGLEGEKNSKIISLRLILLKIQNYQIFKQTHNCSHYRHR